MNNVAKALLFTGQGGQHTGMGMSLYNSNSDFKRIIDDASSILRRDIATLCFSATDEELALPLNSQIATFVYEVGIFEMIKDTELFKDVEFTAGHSIGEYAALYASSSLSLENALTLIKKRSELAEKIYKEKPSSMLATIGLNAEELDTVTKQFDVYMAICNSDTQIVLSGLKDNIAKTQEYIKNILKKKCVLLKVNGCYHTPLMDDIVDEYKDTLNSTLINNAKIECIANTTAKPMWQSSHIFDELRYQLCDSVKWYESMEYLYQEEAIYNYIEIGPKPILAKLIKEKHPMVNVFAISDEGVA